MDQIRMVTIVEAAALALKLTPLPKNDAEALWVFGTRGLIECTLARQTAPVSAWARGQFYTYVRMFEEGVALRQAA